MLQIPLQPVPSQTTSVILGNQNCQIFMYQKPQGLFVDVNADGVEIVTCVLALNLVPIICRKYVGFVGNLMFVDTQGDLEPDYTGLGTRYQLAYMDVGDA